MITKYTGTDETEDGPIRWYSIDAEKYGVTHDGVILWDSGYPVLNFPEACTALREIAKFEASK